MKKLIATILTAIVGLALLGGCSPQAQAPSAGSTGSDSTVATSNTQDAYDFTVSNRDSDASYDETVATKINFAGNSATIDGTGAKANGAIVTVTTAGTYIVSGKSDAGGLVVDVPGAEDKVQLVLNGVQLSATNRPALLVAQADKTFVTLADGSTNTLSDGSGRTDITAITPEALPTATMGNRGGAPNSTRGAAATTAATTSATTSTETNSDTTAEDATADETNATIFSHDDLTINGTGALTVRAANAHGISGKDDLVVTGGKITVQAAGDALKGKDSVKITGGELDLTAGDDGIASTQTNAPYEQGFVSIDGGSINITANDDGVHAETIARLAGGSLNITQSNEGIEGAQVWQLGGAHNVKSADDGINAAGDARTDYLLNIADGSLFVNSEGDGIDSNNTITQSGGTVVVAGPTTSGNGAIDAERSATTSGGTLLAVDSSGMGMTYGSASTQPALLYTPASMVAAGTSISLVAADGTVLFSYTAPKQFSTLAFSAGELEVGKTYSFVQGGELSGATETVKGTYSAGGKLTNGTELTKFTLSENVSQVAADGTASAYNGAGMMGVGGRGGRGAGPTAP